VAGQPISQFFGEQVIGIFQSFDEINNYKSKPARSFSGCTAPAISNMRIPMATDR